MIKEKTIVIEKPTKELSDFLEERQKYKKSLIKKLCQKYRQKIDSETFNHE